jgi:hypothetical protein
MIYTHISHTYFGKENMSWCNKQVVGFAFISLDHAAYNAIKGGSLIVCTKCVEAARSALEWTKLEIHPAFTKIIGE